MTSTSSNAGWSWFRYEHLKNSLKKYGRTGLFTYLGFSLSVTTGIYIALERNVDVRKLLGMSGSTEDPTVEPNWMEKYLVGKGSNIALAMICSKALVPIKLPIAVALTPYVHRLQEKVVRRMSGKN